MNIIFNFTYNKLFYKFYKLNHGHVLLWQTISVTVTWLPDESPSAWARSRCDNTARKEPTKNITLRCFLVSQQKENSIIERDKHKLTLYKRAAFVSREKGSNKSCKRASNCDVTIEFTREEIVLCRRKKGRPHNKEASSVAVWRLCYDFRNANLLTILKLRY